MLAPAFRDAFIAKARSGDKPLSEQSIRNYVNWLTAMVRLTGEQPADMLRNHASTIRKVDGNPRWKSDSTRKSHLNALIVAAKMGLMPDVDVAAVEAVRAHRDELAANIDKATKDNAPPEGHEGLTWDAIERAFNAYADTHGATMETLIVAMYTLIPPRRVGDYWSLKVYKRKPSAQEAETGGNKVYVPRQGPAVMWINEYKTKSTYGTYTTELPGDLTGMMRRSLGPDRGRWRNVLLVAPKSHKPFKDSNTYAAALTAALEKCVGVRMGVTALRKHYVTAKTPGMTMAEREALGRAMGHSVEAALTYYNIVDRDGEAYARRHLEVLTGRLGKVVRAALRGDGDGEAAAGCLERLLGLTRALCEGETVVAVSARERSRWGEDDAASDDDDE